MREGFYTVIYCLPIMTGRCTRGARFNGRVVGKRDAERVGCVQCEDSRKRFSYARVRIGRLIGLLSGCCGSGSIGCRLKSGLGAFSLCGECRFGVAQVIFGYFQLEGLETKVLNSHSQRIDIQ